MRWFREKEDPKIVTLDRHGVLSQVEAYWEALRADRAMPSRSEIDPRAIDTALPHTFLLEMIAPGIARLRVAGTRLSDLMGMEVRGMPVSSLIVPESRSEFARVLDTVVATPARARVRISGEGGFGKPALAGEMLLLPLTDDFGKITRVMGCLTSDGQVGRSPRRFKLESHTLAPVAARTRTVPLPQAAPPVQRPEPGAGKPHLRLVVENT